MVVTVEVIDAVQRTLEQDGLLQSLKAQLRSSVLRIVKQSGERITASNPNLNFVRSFEGAPIIQLVRDILVHLNLRETVLVFDAETGYEEIEGREFETFLQKLGITKSNKNGSYLEQLVQNTLQGPKPSIPHAASREEQVNSKGPSPTIHQSRSMSRSSEEKFTPSPKELKSYLEDDDDDDLNIPDISSAINFSKFLNKSRAEQKEMMLGDDEPQSKPASSTIPNIPASQPKLEEKPVPIVEKRKSPTEHADEDFNNKYKNLLDDDDDDDFEIDDKFFANSKLLGGKKEPEISPVSAAVPTIPTKKEEAKEEVKKEVESEEEDDDDEEQSNPAVQEEESDSFVDDEEEVKYELPKRQSTADEAKITEPIAQRKDGFDSRAEDKQSKGYDNDYDEDYEDDVEEVIDEVQESFEEEEEDEIEQSRIETKPSILSKPSFDLEEKKDDSPKILPQRSRSREDDDDDDEPVFAASSQPKTFGSNSNNSNNLKVDAKVDNLPSIFGNKKPSSLAPLPDLKVPSRFGNNLKDLLTDDAKSFDSSSQGKLQSKKSEDSDKGPEFSEEELEEEEEFSQLDHDLSVNKSFESSRGPGGATGEESSFSQDIPQGKASNVQTKVVNSRYEETKETKEDTNSTSSMGNRANVSRLSQQSTIRSTRGWNDVDERRDNDFAMDEDEDDEETDQTELPYRGASFAPSIATIPGRGQRGGMQLQEADDVANLEFSSDQRHNADDSELHTSYRSNQEEDDDGHLQKNNEQKDDDGEIIIHHDEEEEFDDFEEEEEEEESTPAYQPRAAVKKEIEAPVKAFTTTNKIHEKKQQNEEDDEEEEEDEYNDDYGDDFENEEENLNNSRFSNKASNKGNPPATSNNNNNNNNSRKQEVEEDEEIEEIEEEIDEEDADKMSVGGQSESDDDDDGLGQRWAPKSKPGLTSSNSSLFRQQSGTLPTLNNNNNNKPANRGRYDFSKLNDDDDEDEDEDDNAYTFDLNRGSGSGSGRESKYQSKDEIQKRLKEIDQQVTSMEDEDEEGMLSNIKSTFGKNNTNNNNNNSRASSTASSLRKSSSDLRNLKDFDDRDEDSVASENLSVGDDDNSEEESFSVGH
eukprot:gene9306-10106_t